MDKKDLNLYFSKKPEILAVYLFGSAAKFMDKARDIDIAVLLTKKALKKRDSLDWQIDLEQGLHKFTQKPLDVVILNDASSTLRHEVLKIKNLLYQKDPSRRIDFEVASELEFYDFQPYRRLFWQALVKRINRGRLGSI